MPPSALVTMSSATKKTVHLCVRGKDVFVQVGELESPEEALFRTRYIAMNASDPHAAERSFVESAKRRYGVSFTRSL